MQASGESWASLARDLRALGYDAVDVAGCVRIHLPLTCSVTVEAGPDVPRLSPRFGPFERTTATWFTTGGFVLMLAFYLLVARPGLLLGLMLVAWLGELILDAYRYVLTESALGSIRSLLIARRPA